jgi:hypothetical protein
MKFKNILSSLALLVLFSGCATTGTGPGVEPEPSQEIITQTPAGPMDVTFAGFAFIGEKNKEKLYPYSSKLTGEINEVLFNAAGKINNPSLKLKRKDGKVTMGADYDKGETNSLAFAVSTEKTRIQGYEGNFLVVYEVYAQIVIFDFSEKKVLATYPIRVQYTDFLKEKPSFEHSLGIFKKIYLEPGFKANIINHWVKRMNSIKPKISIGNHIRVTEVVIPSETLKDIPDEASFKKQAGQMLETFLSSNQSVPVVPYGRDGTQKAMRLTFVNREIQDLKLPEPDYGIYLKIRPFKKISVDQGPVEQRVYGSYIDLKLRHIDLDETYMDAQFRHVPITELQKSANIILDDWDEFQKSLQNLFDKFTKQLSIMDSDYFEETTRTENIRDQFRKFMSVIYKVR